MTQSIFHCTCSNGLYLAPHDISDCACLLIATSKSISVEELQEESNLIIYTAGLILMIVWI